MDVTQPVRSDRKDSLDPRVKLLLWLCYTATVSFASNHQLSRLALLAVLLSVCHIAARARAGRVWLFAIPVAALTLSGIVLGGNLTETLSIGCKIVLCAFASGLFAGVTPFGDILAALKGLGTPASATTLMLIAGRYVDVLTADAARMTQAFTLQGAHGSRRPIRQYAMLASAIALRAATRADRIALALQATGFSGEAPIANLPDLKARDVVALALGASAALIAGFGGS